MRSRTDESKSQALSVNKYLAGVSAGTRESVKFFVSRQLRQMACSLEVYR
jgi:hypothetical protein